MIIVSTCGRNRTFYAENQNNKWFDFQFKSTIKLIIELLCAILFNSYFLRKTAKLPIHDKIKIG